MDDLDRLRILSGTSHSAVESGSNISITADQKAELMRTHNIKPGTQEWFRLWFTKPYLTNTSPLDPKFNK